MKKNRLAVLALMVFMCLFSFNSSAFASDDAEDFLKAQALHGITAVNDDEPFVSPKGENDTEAKAIENPTGSAVVTRDEGSVSAPAGNEESAKLYYCVVPKKYVANLEAFCNNHNAPMMVYRSFKQLLVLNKVGCVVTVNPKDKYFISQLRKNYCGKPLKDVSIRVKIHVHSIPYGVNITKEDIMAADFGACDVALQAMIKNVYGHNSTLFKGIAKTFPGLLDKLTVKAKDHWFFGKNKKVLFNPDITIEVLALNMNGKNKNVTLFNDTFNFKTIKHAANYNWNK